MIVSFSDRTSPHRWSEANGHRRRVPASPPTAEASSGRSTLPQGTSQNRVPKRSRVATNCKLGRNTHGCTVIAHQQSKAFQTLCVPRKVPTVGSSCKSASLVIVPHRACHHEFLTISPFASLYHHSLVALSWYHQYPSAPISQSVSFSSVAEAVADASVEEAAATDGAAAVSYP